MNKQELIALLQSHVDFTISEDVFELVEHNSGLDITSENCLLILDEIRKQHQVSQLLQSTKTNYSDDGSSFISNTLKNIKPLASKTAPLNIYAGLRTLSLGLTLCFCLLIFSPFMKKEVNTFVAHNTTIKTDFSDIIVDTRSALIHLESIESQSMPNSIMLAGEFVEGSMGHYPYHSYACINCQSLELHLW